VALSLLYVLHLDMAESPRQTSSQLKAKQTLPDQVSTVLVSILIRSILLAPLVYLGGNYALTVHCHAAINIRELDIHRASGSNDPFSLAPAVKAECAKDFWSPQRAVGATLVALILMLGYFAHTTGYSEERFKSIWFGCPVSRQFWLL